MGELVPELVLLGVTRLRHYPTTALGAEITAANMQDLAGWCGGHTARLSTGERVLMVPTREGTRPGHRGDWLLQGVLAEFYPVPAQLVRVAYHRDTNGHEPPPPLSGPAEALLSKLQAVREECEALGFTQLSSALTVPHPGTVHLLLTELDELLSLLRERR